MKSPAAAVSLMSAAFSLPEQVLLNPPPNPSVIRVNVNLVNVLCSARDKQGGYVSDLRREDFEIREDGRPRPITNFARESDLPLTVALLVDLSGSVASVIPEEKVAAARFFEDVLRPGDRALLAGFAERIAVWQELTASLADVREALGRVAPFPPRNEDDRMGPAPRGGTLLYDAITLVSAQKLQSVAGRKAMVLITDGADVGSIASRKEALEAAQRADTVIYAIHFQGRYLPNAGPGILEKLAQPTGGRAFDATRKMQLQNAFDAIGEEMRNQYALAFTPARPAQDGSYHKLEVKVRRAGLEVQARTGYYAAGR